MVSKVLVSKMEDRLIWVLNINGVVSVKRLSGLLINDGGDNISFAFDKIGKLKVPHRVRKFLWMMAIDRIPTREFLLSRGVQLQQLMNGCP